MPHNDKLPPGLVQAKILTRVHALNETEHEARASLVAIMPDGNMREVATMIIHSYEGGLGALKQMCAEAAPLMYNAIVAQQAGLVLPDGQTRI